MSSISDYTPPRNEEVRLKVAESLYDGERIVSSFGPYFATSRRILLYLERARGLMVRELAYESLSDIRSVNKSNHLLVMTGAALVIVSFLSMPILGVFLPLAGAAAGVYFLILGSVGRPAYYQIEAEGVLPQEQWLWRIKHRGSGSFIATIRIILGKDPRGDTERQY